MTAAAMRAPVALIGVDWGGSALRVALVDAGGRVVAHRHSAAGAFAVEPGGFAAALWPLCGDWLDAHRVPLLACGMIGSRQGIAEVPYVGCPATPDALTAGLTAVALGRPFADIGGVPARLHIVPGVSFDAGAGGVDLARGEETQVLGAAVAGVAAVAAGADIPTVSSVAGAGAAGAGPVRRFVLPGTHSKWMLRGAGGSVEALQTYLTGELFELLSRHGSLARAMAPATAPRAAAQAAAAAAAAAFAQGLAEARAEPLPGLLFRVRAAALTGRLDTAALPAYLSGLLIGAEVDAGLRRFGRPAPDEAIALVGDAALTRRYATALSAAGVATVEVPGDVVFAGLLAIARRAGLVAPVACAAPDHLPADRAPSDRTIAGGTTADHTPADHTPADRAPADRAPQRRARTGIGKATGPVAGESGA